MSAIEDVSEPSDRWEETEDFMEEELFEQQPSPMPALEQARRRVIRCEEELNDAKTSQIAERQILAQGALHIAQREVARLERERFSI